MNPFRAVLFKLRALFDRRALDAELDAELRDHIERETRANVARGMSPSEARRAAMAAFGGVQHYKEETRDAHGVRWVEVFRQDLRYAMRSLGRTPAFCAAVIFTLGAGIGVNSAMFGILDRVVLSPPTAIGDPGAVGHVYFVNSQSGKSNTFDAGNFVQLLAFRDALRPFGTAAQYEHEHLAIERGDYGWNADAELVSANYLRVLRVTPRLGRFFDDEDETPRATDPGVVISYGVWKTRFGGADDVLGKRLWISGHEFPVIGVTPAGFTGADFGKVDLWVPVSAGSFGAGPPNWMTDSHSYRAKFVVRLNSMGDRRNAAAVLARAEHDLVADRIAPDARIGASIMPLAGVRGQDATLSPESRVAEWLFAVAVIVLVIACANVANLFVLRALSRRREIAIRRALGVSRARLAATFLGESALLALGGCATALMAVWAGAPSLRAALIPRVDWSGSPIDARVLAVGLSCAITAALAAGILPLATMGRIDVSDVLKSGGPGYSARRLPIQRALLVLQSSLSLLLLVGAGLFVKSLSNARAIRLGFDVDQVMFVTLVFPKGQDTSASEQVMELARRRIGALGGVEHVSRAQGSPFGVAMGSAFFARGDPPPKPRTPFYTIVHSVTPDYFATLGTRLVRGRNFTEDEGEREAPVAVITPAVAAWKWPGKDPLGECFWTSPTDYGKPCTTVIGVVEDVHQFKLVADSMMPFYRPLSSVDSHGYIFAVRTSGRADNMVEAVRRTVQAISPILPPPRIETMRSRVEPLLWQWKLGAWMFPLFGVLALVVASVGIYSVLAYSTAQRDRELAVRSALGADGRRLIALVLVGEATTVGAGLALGVIVWLAVGRFTRDMLLGVSPLDPLTIVGAGVALAIAGTVASIAPAWRAAGANPVEALRSE